MDKIEDILDDFIFDSNYDIRKINERQQVWRFDKDEGIQLAYLTILPEEENHTYEISISDTAIKLEFNNKIYYIAVAWRYYREQDEWELHYF